MKEKYIKPEIKVTNIEAADIIATSGGMVGGTVSGSANYTTQSIGMVGGTIGGNSAFNDQ